MMRSRPTGPVGHYATPTAATRQPRRAVPDQPARRSRLTGRDDLHRSKVAATVPRHRATRGRVRRVGGTAASGRTWSRERPNAPLVAVNSQSIVPGGLLRHVAHDGLTSGHLFVIRVEMRAITSYGSRDQSRSSRPRWTPPEDDRICPYERRRLDPTLRTSAKQHHGKCQTSRFESGRE